MLRKALRIAAILPASPSISRLPVSHVIPPGGFDTEMGTIVERPRKKSGKAYMAKIILKREGKVIHRETETFDRRPAAAAWIAPHEDELSKSGAIEREAGDQRSAAIPARLPAMKDAQKVLRRARQSPSAATASHSKKTDRCDTGPAFRVPMNAVKVRRFDARPPHNPYSSEKGIPGSACGLLSPVERRRQRRGRRAGAGDHEAAGID